MRPVLSLLAILAIGCGGKPTPRKPDPAKLAAALDADIRELNALALRLEGQCEPLIAELRPHVAKMRAHADDVKLAMNDPELAPRLKAYVQSYGTQHQTLGDATGESLAKSYLGCNQDKRLLELVDLIPVM